MDGAVRALLDTLRARGEAPCLRLVDRDVTTAALLRGVEETAARLDDAPARLAPGDVIALRAAHPVTRVAAPLAAWIRGLSTFLLGDREPPGRVPALLEEAGCRLLLAWDPRGHLDVLASSPPRTVRLPVSTLLRTSGSGGRPKIAVHAVGTHLASARLAAEHFELQPTDVWLSSLPSYHVGGLGIVLRCLVAGAQLALPAPGQPLVEALAHHAPTHVSLVPTQLARLLADPRGAAALATCKTVLVGGGPVATGLRVAALERHVPLTVCYGSTETTALVAASGAPDVVRRPDSAGRPLPGRRVEITADGEIRVGPPGLLQGYLVGGTVVDARDPDGLFATGDLGRLDADGILYVAGRRDRLFVSGGENVQPEEIEAALEALPGVAAAVVVPVPHAEYGQRPVAFVEAGADAPTGEVLASALRTTLPGFKVPDVFYAMPAPRHGSFKKEIARLADLVAGREGRGTLRVL